jgi:hypothetical protein
MIVNPWEFWSLGLQATRMALETLDASAKVVGHRSAILRDAARDPLTANRAELALMVSEKVHAFSAAGQAAAMDLAKLQRLWLGQGGAVSSGMLAALTGQAARSGIRAMRPVHKAATANARRLGGKKRRK